MATVGGVRWSSKRTVDGLPEPWVLSQVTAMELIVGARDKRDLVTLITLNRKHYEMIEGLRLKVPNY